MTQMVRLTKHADKSVTGVLPDGYIQHWPKYVRNRPTRRNTSVEVKGVRWQPCWLPVT